MVNILQDIKLADYTTFGIGGNARYFAVVTTLIELKEAIDFATDNNLKHIILGGGSNILFYDSGFDGLVIHIKLQRYQILGDILITDAGATLADLIIETAKRGLGGWESMYGIPGTLGGAVRGNAGAFGTEIKDVIKRVKALNVHSGEVRDFTNDQCEFAFRGSYFKENPEWVVLTAMLKLRQTESAKALDTCSVTLRERNKRHLQDVKAAGSFFKNPVCTHLPNIIEMFEAEKGVKSRGGKVPAGWLIEKVGLKGKRVRDALSSKQHSNYIINDGNATAEQVLELRDTIKQAVLDEFGIELEEEVTIVI